MVFILINIFFAIVVLISFIILWFVWPPDSPWSPWWQVGVHEIRESLKLARVNENDIVYDLGSGDGRVPITAAREFGARGVGVEIDWLRHLTGLLTVRLYKLNSRVSLKRGNFFNQDIADATVVFLYLVPRVLEKLKPKLFKELKKGTRIISYKYKFRPDNKLKLVQSDEKSSIHLYKIL